MPPFGKKKASGTVYPVFLHAEDPNKKMSYINLTIVDASDAVYKMVHAKVTEKQSKLPGPAAFKNRVAKTVAKTASTRVPASVIAEKLSEKLPKMLMYKMHHTTGMRIAAQAIFIEDTFVVMQLQIQYVDSVRLLNSATEQDDNEEDDDDSVATAVLDEWIEEQGKLAMEQEDSSFVTEAAGSAGCKGPAKNWKEYVVNWLEWAIERIMPGSARRQLEHNHLPGLVQSKITSGIQEMMEKKLAQKSLKAEIAVLSQEEEARFFFSNLQMIRERQTAAS